MKILEVLFALFLLFCAYTIFVWMPYNIYAESQCLAKGFPDHKVSVGLEAYCLNLDGNNTITVEKL